MSVISKRLEKVQKELESINKIRKNRTILCSCGKRHKIAKLELIITYWYEEPRGCTGGDYWNEGEWQFLCPKDRCRNRLLFNDYDMAYDKQYCVGVAAEPTFKSLYKNLFASTISLYEKHTDYNFYNNYFVDKHRKYFELPLKAVATT